MNREDELASVISSLMRWRFRLIEKEFELDTNWIFPEWMTGWVFYALIFLLTGSFWVRVEGARCFMYFLYSYACLMALFVSFYVCDWENHSWTNLVMCYLEDFLNKKKGESKRYEIDSSRMARANPFSFSVDDASSFLRWWISWWIVDGLLADYSNGSKAPFH